MTKNISLVILGTLFFGAKGKIADIHPLGLGQVMHHSKFR